MIAFLQLHIPGESGCLFPAKCRSPEFGWCNTLDAFPQPNSGFTLLPACPVCAYTASKGNNFYPDKFVVLKINNFGDGSIDQSCWSKVSYTS
jgi:hypothetical protein